MHVTRPQRGHFCACATCAPHAQHVLLTCSSIVMATSSSSSSSSSSQLLFEDIVVICHNGEAVDWLRQRGILGNFAGEDCKKCREREKENGGNVGQIRLVKDTSYKTDGKVWRCNNRKCNAKVSIRRGSWCDGSHLSVEQVLKLTYLWVWKCSESFVMREVKIGGEHTIVDWFNFCREVAVEVMQKESVQIGGVGEVVEIDESKFGKRKFNKGRRVDGVWVFGGICRRTRDCFLVPVEDRTASTLIPLIKKWIKPGTKVISDCWKAYGTLKEEGYIHGTVNHSIEFVNSETGDHTQTIESTWRAVKRSLPRSGTRKPFYQSYFLEFLFRRRYFVDGTDWFATFMDKVKTVYTPCQ